MDPRTWQAVYCLADALEVVVRALRLGVMVHAERQGVWMELLAEANAVTDCCKRYCMAELLKAEGLDPAAAPLQGRKVKP